MTFQEQRNYLRYLDEWFSSPQGEIIAEAIQEEFSHLHDLLSGEFLIQLGQCGNNPWLDNFSFRHRWLLSPSTKLQGIHCASLLTALPIERDTVDCLIAPFIVDCFGSKESLLDEIDRVLKPMGYAVFLGVNPYSLWGLWLHFSRQNWFRGMPAFPKSVISLKRMMMHRGYHYCYCNEFYFIPPVSHSGSIRVLSFLNQVGKMISPMPSAFYCLVMQKQVENYIDPIIAEEKKEFLKNSPLCQPVC